MPERRSPRVKKIKERERKHESPIEQALGDSLRKWGIDFRPQEPIGPYFADIFIPDLNVVIECDGKVHEGQIEYDAKRNTYMNERGYFVIRLTGAAILQDPILAGREVMNQLQKIISVTERNKKLGIAEGYTQLITNRSIEYKQQGFNGSEWCNVHKRWENQYGEPYADGN